MSWIRNLLLNLTRKFQDSLKDETDYIHLKLPVEKITKGLEESLKNKFKAIKNQIELRRAKKDDIKSLITIHEQSWHSTPMPYHQLSKDLLKEMIEDSNIIIFIARIDSNDTGFIISYFTGEKKEIGVISGLGILPKFQHKGLGTFLGLTSWNYFKEKGVKELRCRVYKDNKNSYNFIKNLGFEEYEDDLPIWKF